MKRSFPSDLRPAPHSGTCVQEAKESPFPQPLAHTGPAWLSLLGRSSIPGAREMCSKQNSRQRIDIKTTFLIFVSLLVATSYQAQKKQSDPEKLANELREFPLSVEVGESTGRVTQRSNASCTDGAD